MAINRTPSYSDGMKIWQNADPLTTASSALPVEDDSADTAKQINSGLGLLLKPFMYRNEQGDAELFTHLFKGQAAYDHSEKSFYLWRGQYWELDTRREIINYVSNSMASLYIGYAAEVLKKSGASEFYENLIAHGAKLQSLTRVKHILELATAQDGISLAGTEWDSDPDILPVNNGVIDLKTGELRNAHPTEYIRHHSPIDYKGIDEPCPLWEKTMQGIFDGDREMVEFSQRLFGYAITGHVTEHRLPLFLGEEARNGKTTIFETLNKILGGNLCVSLPMRTLMKSTFDADGNKPDPYLVTLKNKRLAYSSESAKGMKLDTAIIKKLTGGDTLNPRGMYEKVNSGFTPTHKLMLFTNDKPTVPPDDYGAWERIMLIELNITFVDNPTKPNERKKDKDLGEKLKAEYSGILAWLVRGCLEWRKQGLNPPDKVTNATEAYREDEDILSEFIDEVCTLGADYEIKVMDIFGRHMNWCKKYDIVPLILKEFKKQMKRKFGESKKKKNGYFYKGIQ